MDSLEWLPFSPCLPWQGAYEGPSPDLTVGAQHSLVPEGNGTSWDPQLNSGA